MVLLSGRFHLLSTVCGYPLTENTIRTRYLFSWIDTFALALHWAPLLNIDRPVQRSAFDDTHGEKRAIHDSGCEHVPWYHSGQCHRQVPGREPRVPYRCVFHIARLKARATVMED